MKKRKLPGARSRSAAKSAAHLARPGARSDRDDGKLSRAWIREIARRVRNSRDPVRYVLVSEFNRKFILYYDVSHDAFVMNDPSLGTLFKRREAAESVRKLLGRNVTVVKFTTRRGKLRRLSPFRGYALRRRMRRRRQLHRTRAK